MANNFGLRTIRNSYCRYPISQRWGKIWETLAREFPTYITGAAILFPARTNRFIIGKWRHKTECRLRAI